MTCFARKAVCRKSLTLFEGTAVAFDDKVKPRNAEKASPQVLRFGRDKRESGDCKQPQQLSAIKQ